MYLFISSDDCLSLHPENTSTNFITELPKPLYLEGEWSCAVVRLNLGNSTDQLYGIYCDIVQNSCVHGLLKPILNLLSQSGVVELPYYIPLNTENVYRIRIILLDDKGKTPKNKPSTTSIVLHIKKDNN